MRRDLQLLSFVRKQNVADGDTSQKCHDEHQGDNAAVPWGPTTNSPQLLVQKFLVALVHLLSRQEKEPVKTCGNWCTFRVPLQRWNFLIHLLSRFIDGQLNNCRSVEDYAKRFQLNFDFSEQRASETAGTRATSR